MKSRFLTTAILGFLVCVFAPTTVQAQSLDPAAIDALFAPWHSTSTPGCTVAVSENHQTVFSRAYGMADLEHDVVNSPETILEPGSVSKQFTAAAAVLLALDGLLSLDDDVRDYFPELPDYGEVITIRHLLNHTSGLRDWGSVAGISGWPRTTRVHTHAQTLDIAARQLSLNYTPGEHYSYTNTGYNLLAMLVERVSGMSFSEFSRTRIFEPLGMSKTSWRDDYTRVVKDRGIAYRPNGQGGFNQNMPFENVHGNGGLLTTVGDLLLFTHALETGALGGQAFLDEMHHQGVLNNGRVISYASGLFIDAYRGVRQIGHSGATAGYRGYLARYPDHGLAVAVMCNVTSGNASRLAHGIVDLYLGDELEGPADDPPTAIRIPRDRLALMSGRFRNTRNHSLAVIDATNEGLRGPWGRLAPETGTRFMGTGGRALEFQDDDSFLLLEANGDSLAFERVSAWEPDEAALRALTGDYHSPEAEVTYSLEMSADRLMLADRYGEAFVMSPLYEDTFRTRMGIMRVERDGRGRAVELVLTQSRVWGLRFDRVE